MSAGVVAYLCSSSPKSSVERSSLSSQIESRAAKQQLKMTAQPYLNIHPSTPNSSPTSVPNRFNSGLPPVPISIV